MFLWKDRIGHVAPYIADIRGVLQVPEKGIMHTTLHGSVT